MLSPFRDADFTTLRKGNFNCIEQGMFFPFTNLSSIINNKTFNLRQILSCIIFIDLLKMLRSLTKCICATGIFFFLTLVVII